MLYWYINFNIFLVPVPKIFQICTVPWLFVSQQTLTCSYAAQKMKFSIKDLVSKCDQIRRKLRIWSHLLEKSLMENFIFCAVIVNNRTTRKCCETCSKARIKTPEWCRSGVFIFNFDHILHMFLVFSSMHGSTFWMVETRVTD